MLLGIPYLQPVYTQQKHPDTTSIKRNNQLDIVLITYTVKPATWGHQCSWTWRYPPCC